MDNAPGDNIRIFGGNPVQGFLDRSEQHRVQSAGLRLGSQEERAEHRHKCQSGGRGDDHDDCHDPTKLLEHDAGHAGSHRKRQEHAEHGQSRCNDGNTHFGSSMDGGLLRFLTPFKMGGDVLKNHDRIIHNHTDRYGERGHRNDVQGVAGGKKIDQRAQERDRDRKDDYEGGPPSSQEDEHDKHHDKQGDEDCLLEGVDGVDDVVGTVDND